MRLVSTNPAKRYEKIGEIAISTKEEIMQKVTKAQAAKQMWKELGVAERVKLLTPVYEDFVARSDEIALLCTRETGRAITESKGIVAGHLDKIKWFLNNAEDALTDVITHEDENTIHRVVYEPIGVAAVITPWNHPFGMFVWGVFPNLLAGNTVVYKISEECPLVGKLIEEIMLAHDLPEGVFAEIYGDGRVGQILVHENIDLIWFTGSTKVGQELYRIAGEKFITAILELGGSNPCILFEDTDVKKSIAKLYAKRFKLCGQTCDALKRLIVHESIFDKVVEELKKEIESKKVGQAEDPESDLGSLVAKRQLDLLKEQMQDATDKGATIVTGGKEPEGLDGAYYLPTLVTSITRDMRVWKEEVFGPVLPVISFKTEEEAIELANETEYGLGSIVFTNDSKRGERVASRLEAGSVEINNAIHWHNKNPFGGYKKSGKGREHGIMGFHELCQIKLISKEK